MRRRAPRCSGRSRRPAPRPALPARGRSCHRGEVGARTNIAPLAGLGGPPEGIPVMHVGMAVIFQDDPQRADHEVYRDELRLVGLAEPLGFESVWGVEHHLTGYTRFR